MLRIDPACEGRCAVHGFFMFTFAGASLYSKQLLLTNVELPLEECWAVVHQECRPGQTVPDLGITLHCSSLIIFVLC